MYIIMFTFKHQPRMGAGYRSSKANYAAETGLLTENSSIKLGSLLISSRTCKQISSISLTTQRKGKHLQYPIHQPILL